MNKNLYDNEIEFPSDKREHMKKSFHMVKNADENTEGYKRNKELQDQNIPHIFFNGNNDFGPLSDREDWGTSYIEPYDPNYTFNNLIQAQGIDTVSPKSWHFGRDGHSYFCRFMLQYIIKNKLI